MVLTFVGKMMDEMGSDGVETWEIWHLTAMESPPEFSDETNIALG